MARGLKNNNPLNIEKSKGKKWLGEVESTDVRFAQFISMAHGYRAAFKLLDNYRKNHGCRILSDFINRWAPPVENHTHNYINTVAKRAGLSDVSVIDTLNELQMQRVVSAMSFVENGVPADEIDVMQGWYLFKNS